MCYWCLSFSLYVSRLKKTILLKNVLLLLIAYLFSPYVAWIQLVTMVGKEARSIAKFLMQICTPFFKIIEIISTKIWLTATQYKKIYFTVSCVMIETIEKTSFRHSRKRTTSSLFYGIALFEEPLLWLWALWTGPNIHAAIRPEAQAHFAGSHTYCSPSAVFKLHPLQP